MSYKDVTVLIVDDDPSTLVLFRQWFLKTEWEIVTKRDPLQALEWMSKNEPSVIFLDVQMPHMNGLEMLENIRSMNYDMPVVMMSAYGTIKLTVKAMKMGAYDFLTKPFEDREEVLLLAHRAVHEWIKKKDEKATFKPGENGKLHQSTTHFVGNDPKVLKVNKIVDKIARVDSTVLITGKSGTGKELIARLIHEKSDRGKQEFVAVNTCALPAELVESTLFGYEKGAFTGAYKTRKGLLEEARGGTLFLDEIGDISPSFQAKLLRVLQEKEFQKVGGTKTLKTDARIIAATNKDLYQEVRQGRFREDLYFRLNVIHISLPSLEERGQDIRLLAQHFLNEHSRKHQKSISGFDETVIQYFEKYPWPGNVRQLENVVEFAVSICETDRIDLDCLPEYLKAKRPRDLSTESQEIVVAVEEAELKMLVELLKRTNGNMTQAARLAGLSRQTLYNKCKKYHQNPADFKD